MNTAATLRAKWKALHPRNRHWLGNIFWGVLIELFLLFANAVHFEPVQALQDSALDRMMRTSAEVGPANSTGPPLAFLDIDDATWRGQAWGGGEPYRAPRDGLFALIDYAFAQGARQVVLDVLVEGRAEDEDERFAQRLRGLLAQDSFASGKQLILARSIRRALEPGFPDELRPSVTDTVVAESNHRIVIGAPYFRYSADHVLRDWQLLEIACRGRQDRQFGRWDVVPAVQLLVAAHQASVPLAAMLESTASPLGGDCIPVSRPTGPASESALKAQEEMMNVLLRDRWQRIRQAFAAAGIDLGASPPTQESLGNRIVFRIQDPPRLNQAQVIPASEVLDGRAGRRALDNAIVVIGQSYPEAGDRHQTPLGDMAGSMVILNGIDSMLRHQVIRPPSLWLRAPLVVLLIVFIGYVFSRWDSEYGTLIAMAVVMVVLFVGSYHLFKHGVWLDFALPFLGIQVHRLIKSFEERIEHRRLARAHGIEH